MYTLSGKMNINLDFSLRLKRTMQAKTTAGFSSVYGRESPLREFSLYCNENCMEIILFWIHMRNEIFYATYMEFLSLLYAIKVPFYEILHQTGTAVKNGPISFCSPIH